MTHPIKTISLTLKSRLTVAVVVVDEILTGSVVAARGGQTLVILGAAVLPGVARLAPTLEAARLVATNPEVADILLRGNIQTITGPALPARGAALVNVQLAVVSLPALETGTLVFAHQVTALAPVLAGSGRALVYILAAVGALVTHRTCASVVVDLVKALLEGWALSRGAVIDVVLAPGAVEAILARAGEVISPCSLLVQRHAGPVVTGLLRTRIIRGVTGVAHEPRAALAAEGVDAVHTISPIVTGATLAFVDVDFTGLPRKPSWTGALIVIILGINRSYFTLSYNNTILTSPKI